MEGQNSLERGYCSIDSVGGGGKEEYEGSQ